jgi:protein-tyrosine phosphatase
LADKGFIDVHSHFLYGVDDGAATLEDSLAMLRMAAKHGTSDIVASPHANMEYHWDGELNRQRLAEIAAASDSGIRLHAGCDFHLQYENIEDAIRHPRKYTIAGKQYLLVEFSDLIIFKSTTQIFSDLLAAGMVPLITHPERNLLLQMRLAEIREWVGMGCGVQVTGQSLLGHFGSKAQRFSETLLDEQLVHVAASDGHDVKRRPPILDDAYNHLRERWGELTARRLCQENPSNILRGLGWAGTSEKRKRKLFGIF